MILLIGSQKGGCGKSTTAASICAELAAQGKDVVLVDADRQSTAANWAADRQGNEALPVVHCIQKYDNIRQTLLDLDKRYGEAREYLQDFPAIQPLRTLIHDRKVYRDSMSIGMGVTEMGNPKAKAEIQELLKELL
jgi:cellulose biosynthesis protein BcsQ